MANQRPWEALNDLVVVKSGCVTILMILLILISVVGASTQSPRDMEIEDLLKKLNKQPIKTLQSPDGEIIDCVDIYKQSAFDHPLLKNHTIEMRPSFDPRMGDRSNCSSEYAKPIWRQNERCPEGTIPIRRVRKSDLLRAKSLESFETVHPNPYTVGTSRVEIALAEMSRSSYYGIKGDLSVWKPLVESGEFSTSSITVIKGTENSLHSIQVGWTVAQHMFGNDEPRIFVSWVSREGNNVRGCLNHFCSGFIQINPTFVLGSALTFSTIGGSLEKILLQIRKRKTKNNQWWVNINGIDVGYYPVEIFPNFNQGTSVDWRGEVMNRMNLGHHTTTQMGSGQFANGGYGRAAHFENMAYAYHYNRFRPAEGLQIVASFPRCYNAILYPPPSGTSEPSLSFGGLGGMHCDQEPSS